MNSVYVEITTNCNLCCKSCYNASGTNKDKSATEMSLSLFEGMLNTLSRININRVILSGGEPMLHKDFDQILEHIHDRADITFLVITNGTIHQQHFFDVYAQCSNLEVQISLDGATESSNAATRGSGVFSKALEFLEKSYRYNPVKLPRLKMTISRQNQLDIEAFYHLALQSKAIPEFAFVRRQGSADESWKSLGLTPEEKATCIILIERLNYETDTQAFFPLCETSCPLSDVSAPLSLYIRPDGRILPCQMMSGGDAVLGNIFTLDIEAFQQERYKIAILAQQRETQDYDCYKCFLRSVCKRGCMAEAILYNGHPLKNDGQCGLRKIQHLKHELRSIRKATKP